MLHINFLTQQITESNDIIKIILYDKSKLGAT